MGVDGVSRIDASVGEKKLPVYPCVDKALTADLDMSHFEFQSKPLTISFHIGTK